MDLIKMHAIYPIILLSISNIFMTFAWYGHFKFKNAPLLLIILLSWFIAFFEYLFQVPANRIGHVYFSAAQLRVMQEFISLFIFILFSTYYLGEVLKWNHILGLLIILIGVMVVFYR